MKNSVVRATAAAALVVSTCVAVAVPAEADTGPTDQQLASALDLAAGTPAGGPSLSVTTEDSDPAAVAVTGTSFNDFPSTGADYVLLSTGRADDVFPGSRSVPGNQPSTDLGGDRVPDTTSLTVTVAARAEATCLLVDFAMGTEERVHTYTEATRSDALTVTLNDQTDNYAQNQGGAYIDQAGVATDERPYTVNSINYWHAPGDRTDPQHNTAEEPRLPATASPLNHFTTRDTAEVPLPAAGTSDVIKISVADAGNASLDSVAMVDQVRLAPSCSRPAAGMTPNTGIATGNATIVGYRGVGNVLTLDPVASTPQVEKYDSTSNGWFPEQPRPVELRFRWYRIKGATSTCYNTSLSSWTPIPDADRQSYVPTNLDKGKCLMVRETGVKDGYRTETYPTPGSQNWYVTLPIQDGTFDTGLLTISGDMVVGSVLTANIPTYSPTPDSFSVQWLQDGVSISGATGPTYAITADQAGKHITAKVTGKRSGFKDATVVSPAYDPVELLVMDHADTPTLTGNVRPGAEVTAVPGAWVPAPSKFTYQWKLDGENVRYATQATYTPKPVDAGRMLSVAVTGAPSGYAPLTAESSPVAIGNGTMGGMTPTMQGTLTVGQRLTAGTTGWQPVGSKLEYTWRADGTLLSTARSFILPGSAAGRKITLTVRGTLAGYEPLERTSVESATVARGTLSSRTPTTRGSFKVNGRVYASTVGWSPSAVTFRYQWMLNGKNYPGARSSSWKLSRSAKGKRVSVKVTGVLTGYTEVSRTSSKSRKVGG